MAHLLLTIMDHIYIVKGKILGERLNGGGEELLVVSTSPTRYFRITTPCASLPPPTTSRSQRLRDSYIVVGAQHGDTHGVGAGEGG